MMGRGLPVFPIMIVKRKKSIRKRLEEVDRKLASGEGRRRDLYQSQRVPDPKTRGHFRSLSSYTTVQKHYTERRDTIMDNHPIIYDDTLKFETNYHEIKSSIQQRLQDSIDLYEFDDNSRQIQYPTEGPLVPNNNGKIPILILLSNPHPHSVRQGMFLSPNRAGKENPFWNTLRGTGYFRHADQITPSLMIENRYDSPFRIFIAVLLSFPSNFPHELPEIFGIEEYRKMIIAGKARIETLLMEHDIKNVICFGKTQFDIDGYGGSCRIRHNI